MIVDLDRKNQEETLLIYLEPKQKNPCTHISIVLGNQDIKALWSRNSL